jgi:hypothetical protein
VLLQQILLVVTANKQVITALTIPVRVEIRTTYFEYPEKDYTCRYKQEEHMYILTVM